MEWLANLFGFGRLTVVDDSGELQVVQLTEGAAGSGFADRVIDGVRRISEFGFASVPPLDSEAIAIRRGGDRARSVVIGTSHRPSRPRGLKPGDAGIYDVRGARVMLTENGLVIDGAGLPVTIRNANKVRVEADLVEVTGDVVSRADGARVSLNGLRDAYAAHKHGQVRAGTDASGPTDHQA